MYKFIDWAEFSALIFPSVFRPHRRLKINIIVVVKQAESYDVSDFFSRNDRFHKSSWNDMDALDASCSTTHTT